MKVARNRLTSYRNRNLSLILVGAFCMSASASDLNFLQIHGMQATYGDIPGFDLRGAEVRGGFGWKNVFTEFRFRKLDDTSGDRKLEDERWNISLGYSYNLSTNLRADIRANYGSIELEGSSPTEYFISKPKYEGISGFIHYDYSDRLNLYGGLEWQNLPNNADQKAYHLGAMYEFDWMFVGAEYTKYSDTDAISLFVRYEY